MGHFRYSKKKLRSPKTNERSTKSTFFAIVKRPSNDIHVLNVCTLNLPLPILVLSPLNRVILLCWRDALESRRLSLGHCHSCSQVSFMSCHCTVEVILRLIMESLSIEDTLAMPFRLSYVVEANRFRPLSTSVDLQASISGRPTSTPRSSCNAKRRRTESKKGYLLSNKRKQEKHKAKGEMTAAVHLNPSWMVHRFRVGEAEQHRAGLQAGQLELTWAYFCDHGTRFWRQRDQRR